MLKFLYRKLCWCAWKFVRLLEHIYDLIRGVDFNLTNRKYEGDGRNEYAVSSLLYRKAIGKYLRGKVTPDDAIIDIGCGKCQMLYFFSKFPFRKIGGLEYSQRLIDIAERNMQKLLTRGGGGQLSRSFREMQQYIRITTNIIISTSTTLSQM